MRRVFFALVCILLFTAADARPGVRFEPLSCADGNETACTARSVANAGRFGGSAGFIVNTATGGPGDRNRTQDSRDVVRFDPYGNGSLNVLVVNYEQNNDLFVSNRAGGWRLDTSIGGPGDPTSKKRSRGVITFDPHGNGSLYVLVVNYNQTNDLFVADGAGGWRRDLSRAGPGNPARVDNSIGALSFEASNGSTWVLVLNDHGQTDVFYRIDGDGRWYPEIAWVGGGGASNAGERRSPAFTNRGDHLESVGAVSFDADGDGHADVLVLVAKKDNRLYLSDGKGGFVHANDQVTEECDLKGLLEGSFAAVASFDANGDGQADVLALANTGTANCLYLSDRTAGLRGWLLDRSINGPGSAGTVAQDSIGAMSFDANGDGHIDVLVINGKSTNTLYLGDGGGDWQHDSSRDGLGATGSRVVGSIGAVSFDCDGNGRADVLVINKRTTNITRGNAINTNLYADDLYQGTRASGWGRDDPENWSARHGGHSVGAVSLYVEGDGVYVLVLNKNATGGHNLFRVDDNGWTAIEESGTPGDKRLKSQAGGGAVPFSANEGKHEGVLVLSADGDPKVREKDGGIYLVDAQRGWKKKQMPANATLSFAAGYGGVSFDANGLTFVLVVNNEDANTLYRIDQNGAWTAGTWAAIGNGAWNLMNSTSKGAVSFEVHENVYVLVLNGGQADGMFFIDGNGDWHADTDINGPGSTEHASSSDDAVAFAVGGVTYVLVANKQQPNDLYFIDGSGSWQRDTSSGGPGDPKNSKSSVSVLSFDADGDGNTDVLVINQNQASYLFLSDGTGGWRQEEASLGSLVGAILERETIGAVSIKPRNGGRASVLVVNAGQPNDLYNWKSCPAGFGVDSQDASVCLTCSVGRYRMTAGMTAGSYTRATDNKCIECPPGYASPEIGRGVTIFEPGRFGCVPCGETEYRTSNAGMANCARVPEGSIGIPAPLFPTVQRDLVSVGISPCSPGSFCPGQNVTTICANISAIRCPRGSKAPIAVRAGFVANATGDEIPCKEGHFCVAGTQTPCQQGQNQSTTGASECEECPKGQFQDREGQLSCDDIATPGFYSAKGVRLPCPPGTFSDQARATSCEACPAKTYQDEINATRCKACGVCTSGLRQACGGAFGGFCGTCSPGTFTSGSTCAACLAGSFSDAENAANCDVCPAGFFQPAAGKGFCLPHSVCAKGERVASPPNATTDRTCAPCSTMQFSNVTNAVKCEHCPSGKFQESPGQGYCETCSEGYVCRADEKTGIVEKQECPASMQCSGASMAPCTNQISNPTIGKCVSCGDRKFANSQTNVCMDCPLSVSGDGAKLLSGVECKGGDIHIETDYFVEGSDAKSSGVPLGPDIRVIKCRGTNVCESAVNKTDFTVKTECIAPAAGALCGACKDQHIKGAPGSPCVACTVDGKAAPVLLLLAALLVFAILYRQTIKSSLKNARRGHRSKYMTFSLLKIIMTFLFKTSLLAHFNLDWGGLMGFIFQAGSVTGSGDATKMASAQCFGLNLHAKTKLMFAAPFIVMVLPLPMLLKARLTRRTTMFGVSQREAYQAAVLIGWWLVHPAVLAHCIVTMLTLTVGGKEFALADLSIETVDPEYATSRTLAVVLLCTFVPALPLFIANQLYRWRDPLRAGEQDAIPAGPRIWLFYFYGTFTPARYYWELVAFAIRTTMVLLSALSSTYVEHGALQLIVFVTMWVTLFNFLCVFKCKPYVRRNENKINNLAQGALLALLLCAMGLCLEDAQQHTKWLRSVLLIFCATVLIITLVIALVACALSWRDRRIDQRIERLESESAKKLAVREDVEDCESPGEQHIMHDNPLHLSEQEVSPVPATSPNVSSSPSVAVFEDSLKCNGAVAALAAPATASPDAEEASTDSVTCESDVDTKALATVSTIQRSQAAKDKAVF